MGNLIDIQTQIRKLQKQADEIRSKEFDKTVQEIVGKMQAFGITLKDVQAALGKPGAGKGRGKAVAKESVTKKTGKKTAIPVAAKYRGPNGETWSGRGLAPRWLAALMAQGRAKEDFAIKS